MVTINTHYTALAAGGLYSIAVHACMKCLRLRGFKKNEDRDANSPVDMYENGEFIPSLKGNADIFGGIWQV